MDNSETQATFDTQDDAKNPNKTPQKNTIQHNTNK